MTTIKILQDGLAWDEKTYNDVFMGSTAAHKHFEHAFVHASKAVGRLAAIIDDGDHKNCRNYPRGEVRKFLADLVICALRMANKTPGGKVDLQEAVLARIEEKMEKKP